MNKKLNTKTIVNRFKESGQLNDIQEYLTVFWSQFQSQNKKWKNLEVIDNSNMPKGKKLELLKIMTEVKLDDPSFYTRKKRRDGFNKERNKRSSLTDNQRKKMFVLNDSCFVCDDVPHHRHHIIQLQHGGRNIYKNIVHLCQTCHGKVHNIKFG